MQLLLTAIGACLIFWLLILGGVAWFCKRRTRKILKKYRTREPAREGRVTVIQQNMN